MKTNTYLTALMLMLALVFSCAIPAVAQTEVIIDGIKYSCSGEEATVVGLDADFNNKILSFPTEVKDAEENTYRVTRIAEGAINNRDFIEEIVIPPSVTHIEVGAFTNCGGVQSLRFSDGEEVLYLEGTEVLYLEGTHEEHNFKGLTNVSYLYLGRNISANQGKFSEMSLTKIDFGKLVTTLTIIDLTMSPKINGAGLFAGCNQLETLDIPEWITTVGDKTFADCTALRSVTVRGNIPYSGLLNFSCANVANIENIYAYSIEPEVCYFMFYDSFANTSFKTNIHVKPEAKSAYESYFANAKNKNGHLILDDLGKTYPYILDAGEGGSLVYEDKTAHNEVLSVEPEFCPEYVEVRTVPDHGYEFKQLTVTDSNGETVAYTFTHAGGDIIATIPFFVGMTVSAVFSKPLIYTLTMKNIKWGEIAMDVPQGKSYSLNMNAPLNGKVKSITFNGAELPWEADADGKINITTPPLNQDSELLVTYADTMTEISPEFANTVRVKAGEGVIEISGLSIGSKLLITDPSGVSGEFTASQECFTFAPPMQGIYIIRVGNSVYKVLI